VARCRGRGIVGLELVRPSEWERVRVEVRDVPEEEAPDEAGPHRLAHLEPLEQAEPRFSNAVDERAEAPVRPRQMAKLVRDDGTHLLGRERIQVRESEHQIVP
jgi:hypothetical protein